MKLPVKKLILYPEDLQEGPRNGKKSEGSDDADANEVERDDDDDDLLPDNDDDFDENYGDLDGANDRESLPDPDKGHEIL